MTQILGGHRRLVAAGAAAVLALSVLSACGSDSDQADNSASPSASGGTASASTSPSPLPSPSKRAALPTIGTPEPAGGSSDLKVVVNALRRGSGGLLTLVWTVTNTSEDKTINVGVAFSESPYNYIGSAVQGVTLINHQAKEKYYPLVDDSVQCFCANFTSVGSTNSSLKPGLSITMFDYYKPSTMPTSVEVDIQGFQPLKNVKVPT